MFKAINKNANRKARHARVRKKISGTSERPRLTIFKSKGLEYPVVFICGADKRTKYIDGTRIESINIEKPKTTIIDV